MSKVALVWNTILTASLIILAVLAFNATGQMKDMLTDVEDLEDHISDLERTIANLPYMEEEELTERLQEMEYDLMHLKGAVKHLEQETGCPPYPFDVVIVPAPSGN